MTHSQLGQIEQFAKQFHSDDPQHDWEHIIRVRVNALELAKHYPETNVEILQAACFLHDIGRSIRDEGHPEESVKLAAPYLKEIELTDDEIESISHAIHCHDVKKIHEADSIEAKLLFDADKLEILSVFGFLRVVVFLMEERHMKITEAVNFLWDFSVIVYEKLLNTEEAKALVSSDMDLLSDLAKKYNSWDQRIKN